METQQLNIGRKIETVEQIISPAICMNDGTIFQGASHDKIRNETGKKDEYYDMVIGKKYKEGFMTSDGRFVPRKEAAEIAFIAGQIPEKLDTLHSYDL